MGIWKYGIDSYNHLFGFILLITNFEYCTKNTRKEQEKVSVEEEKHISVLKGKLNWFINKINLNLSCDILVYVNYMERYQREYLNKLMD